MGRSWSLTAVVMLALALVGIFANVVGDGAKGKEPERTSGPRYEFTFLDPDNASAMEEWGKGICEGATVPQMAAFFEVPPTEAAVLKHIEMGLPERAAEVVRKACAESMRAAEAGGKT